MGVVAPEKKNPGHYFT